MSHNEPEGCLLRIFHVPSDLFSQVIINVRFVLIINATIVVVSMRCRLLGLVTKKFHIKDKGDCDC